LHWPPGCFFSKRVREENNLTKEEQKMRRLAKFSLLRPAIALAVLVLTAGAVSADVTSLAIDQDATLLAGRTQATVTGTIECTATETASITVHIYQPTGRLLNIGIGTLTVLVTCTGVGVDDVWTVDVSAIPGLKFKPGPATAVANASTATGSSEVGAKIKLKKP
jgi:hypothetical protein